jgi:8-oxo-dGTP pyrophosphatase MutT (NUDIX family)
MKSPSAKTESAKADSAKTGRVRAAKPGLQYAALPYRHGKAVEILLVTSRETKRWVIPKGWPMKDKKPHGVAAQEAFEEAGVRGKIGKTSIGTYPYIKRLKNGGGLACIVDVYPLKVVRQRKHWPEQHQRTAHWFTIAEAVEAVQELELAALIERFGRTLRAGKGLAKKPF